MRQLSCTYPIHTVDSSAKSVLRAIELEEEGSPSSRAAAPWPIGAVVELSSGPRVHVGSNVYAPLRVVLPLYLFWRYARYSKPKSIVWLPCTLVNAATKLCVSMKRASPVFSELK